MEMLLAILEINVKQSKPTFVQLKCKLIAN